MKIEHLTDSLDIGKTPADLKGFEVSGISCNSKEAMDNFIFVAVKGESADGHKFIPEAIDNGAKIIVVQDQRFRARIPKGITVIVVKDTRKALAKLAARFYGNSSKKIKVIGVTGTNGKTTVTYLIEALLKNAGFSPGVIGTISYRYKDKSIPSKNTTPGPCQLQPLLARMAGEGVNYVIMEVSSHALSQERTEGIDFQSAIFTNLTQDHLDYHKTVENYFQAKVKLFKGIGPGGLVVTNNDDRYGRRLKGLIRGAKIITYAIEEPADIVAKNIKYAISHTEFLAVAKGRELNLKTRLIGRHNLYNVLAGLAWALEEGLDHKIIKSSLENFDFVPGRLQEVETGSNFTVFVDYAHTEDALNNVIRTLREVCAKRIIVVFGCGGERDKTKRPKMGYVASELADYVIITSDNPRSEDPGKIIEDIRKGIRKNNYLIIPQRKTAIKKSLSLAEAGDIVLVAGKGHEHYQILKDSRIDFDDCQIIRECLS